MLLLGRTFASFAPGATVIALEGGLGMGKTVFCKGLAEGLGIPGDVTSPTFAIIAEYRAGDGRSPSRFVHIDAYRLSSGDELDDIGFKDYLDRDTVCALEWSENVQTALPPDAWIVGIELSGPGDARIVRARGIPDGLREAWIEKGGILA